MYGNANDKWNIGISDPLFFRTGIFREVHPIFHSISKENEERNLAPMSRNGVKIIVAIAFCLAVFDRKPRKPDKDTEIVSAEDPDAPPKSPERLSMRLYPERRIAPATAALGIA